MDLSLVDRQRLRSIVRKTHRKLIGKEGLEPTDLMCDELIDALGPEVAAKMVRQAVDQGLV